MKRVVLVSVLVSTVMGCSSGGGIQTRKVAFVLPQGWVKAETDDKSIAIAVPPGFRQGANSMFGTGSNPFDSLVANDPSSAQMTPEEKKKIEQVTGNLNEMAKEDEMKNLDALAKKGILLQCISTGRPTPGEELTRFYVKRKSQGPNWTWSDADGSEQDCFKTKQKATEVKLPIGLAHRMQDSWQLVDGANYTQISYLVPKGSDLYILRLITVEAPAMITTNEKAIAESLRIN
jgi:hypothetical protein